MSASHIDPAEAVVAMRQMHATHAMGIHFETFSGLTDDPWGGVYTELEAALHQYNEKQDRFRLFGFGQTCVYDHSVRCGKPVP